MGFIDNIKRFIGFHSSDLISTKSKELGTKDEITQDDLYIHEGPGFRLNVEKLDKFISQGIDNDLIRNAIKEKERNDKYEAIRLSIDQ